MKKIILKVHNTEIQATLNNTTAAKDFYLRLPLILKFTDSGVDYSTQYQQGKYTIEEMQRGWENGDIVWNGVFYQ